MVRSVNMKKTKSSKKIVLKITMSMTYLFPEVVEFPLVHGVLHFQSPADQDLALEVKA